METKAGNPSIYRKLAHEVPFWLKMAKWAFALGQFCSVCLLTAYFWGWDWLSSGFTLQLAGGAILVVAAGILTSLKLTQFAGKHAFSDPPRSIASTLSRLL